MMTQAGPKKLQMEFKFNQQLKCILRVFNGVDYISK